MRTERHWRPYPVDTSCVLYLPFYKYGAEQTKIWDISGQNNHGTITGAVPGYEGLGWGFDGVNDNIDCGNASSFQFGSGSLSILTWVKSPTTGPYVHHIISGVDLGIYGGWSITLDEYTTSIQISDGATYKFRFHDTIVPTDSWINCTAVIDRGDNFCKIHYNGIRGFGTGGGFSPGNDDISALGALDVGASDVRVGVFDSDFSGSGGLFCGSIGEILLFNRALSAQEIRNYYELTRHIYGV